MGDHVFYDILSLDENNAVEAINIKATVPALVEVEQQPPPPQPTIVGHRHAHLQHHREQQHQHYRQHHQQHRQQQHQQHRRREPSHPLVHGVDVIGAPVLSHGQVGQSIDTSPGIVPSGAAHAQQYMSLGHLRKRFDAIDVGQTGFITQYQFEDLAANLGMVVTPSMIVPQMTFNVFVRHYYASRTQQRRTSIAGRNRHLPGCRSDLPSEIVSGTGFLTAAPCVDPTPGVGAADNTIARSSVTPNRRNRGTHGVNRGTHGMSNRSPVFGRTAQTTDDLPRGGVSLRSVTKAKIDGEALIAIRTRVRTPVTDYPNLRPGASTTTVSPPLKPAPSVVGAIPSLVHADTTSDEETPLGMGTFGLRHGRGRDALSSDEEGSGNRHGNHFRRRYPLAVRHQSDILIEDRGGSSLFAGFSDDDDARNPTLRDRGHEHSTSPVGMARRPTGYTSSDDTDSAIDMSRGKPMTPLPDLRAPFFDKGQSVIEMHKRHRGHRRRENHVAVANSTPGGVVTADSGQSFAAADSRIPGGAAIAQHSPGDSVDGAGIDDNKMHKLPFVLHPLVEQRTGTGSRPAALDQNAKMISKRHKKKNKRKAKHRRCSKDSFFTEAGLDDAGVTVLHTLLQEARQSRCHHQDHYVAKDRQTLTPLVTAPTQMEVDLLDEHIDGINDDKGDTVATKTKTTKVGRLLSPLVHKAAKDSSSRERIGGSRRRNRRRNRRSPAPTRKLYKGLEFEDDDNKNDKPGCLQRKAKALLGAPQPRLLGIYGRPLDQSEIEGIKAQTQDPNESSLEQNEIQSRLRLWQERQEKIERQQQELKMMMCEEKAQRFFGDRFWGYSQLLVVDGKKKTDLVNVEK